MLQSATKKVQAIIFDWAGTTVDYGSFAPVEAFIQVFQAKGIHITAHEIRLYMGLLKKDHLRQLLKLERIEIQWAERFGKKPDENAVDELYRSFEPMLIAMLPDFCEPIPGIVDLVGRLRERGLKIGSTTGYTAKMMEIVAPGARKKGYYPDIVVTSDQLPSGRPEPYMCFKNAIELKVYPLDTFIKVGDSVSDIEEGVNAGMWSVGLIKGGSELGLTLEEVEQMPADELTERMHVVRERMKSHGAHFVMDSVLDLEAVIDEVNTLLAHQNKP